FSLLLASLDLLTTNSSPQSILQCRVRGAPPRIETISSSSTRASMRECIARDHSALVASAPPTNKFVGTPLGTSATLKGERDLRTSIWFPNCSIPDAKASANLYSH